MKKKMALFFIIISLILLSACTAPWDHTESEKQYDGYIYYLNQDRNDLRTKGFGFENMRGQALADAIADKLAASPDDAHVSPLPDGVFIEKVLLENDEVKVTFNKLFEQVDEREKTLCRAAVVKSFTQIPEANYVSFYIGEELMEDDSGNAYEKLTANDYLIVSAKDIEQEQILTLYYGDQEGSHLAKESVPASVAVDQNIIRIIIERLIEGPAYEEETSLISDDTTLLSVSVSDDTAYINLSGAFSDTASTVSPELTVYSIVNSVLDNTSLKKVQILVDGEAPASFGGQMDLRFPLEIKRSLIKEWVAGRRAFRSRSSVLARFCLCLIVLTVLITFFISKGHPYSHIFFNPEKEVAEEAYVSMSAIVTGKTERENGQTLILKTKNLICQNQSAGAFCFLIYDAPEAELKIGDHVTVSGTIEYFEYARNPGCFDLHFYHGVRGIGGMIKPASMTVERKSFFSLKEIIYRFSVRSDQVIRTMMGEEYGSVLSSMIL